MSFIITVKSPEGDYSIDWKDATEEEKKNFKDQHPELKETPEWIKLFRTRLKLRKEKEDAERLC